MQNILVIFKIRPATTTPVMCCGYTLDPLNDFHNILQEWSVAGFVLNITRMLCILRPLS